MSNEDEAVYLSISDHDEEALRPLVNRSRTRHNRSRRNTDHLTCAVRYPCGLCLCFLLTLIIIGSALALVFVFVPR